MRTNAGFQGGDHRFLTALVAAGTILLGGDSVAHACGCLSPPAVTEGEFAVNQQSEQIIFEVEPGWVTAHVLIQYAGNPASFAWIVPVPEAPELDISPISAFGLLDRATSPVVTVQQDNLCPRSEWACKYHASPDCGDDYWPSPENDNGAGGGGFADAGTSGQPPVTVIDEQVVGDYQTVTFRANESQAAVQWLRDNGFIVNQTTSIYMEPYIAQNMVFVAIKLVPGAGIKSIKPLKLRYRSAFPMVPLVLTAVAAEPHLTVTSYVYADEAFRPLGRPVVTIDPDRIARDRTGRVNYPMVLARTIDEHGGDAFAIEYRGGPAEPTFGQGGTGPFGNCCSNDGYDFCSIGGNAQCECPNTTFDRADCEAQAPDLVAGVDLLTALGGKYDTLTRITTRVSPEEMRFDPTFEPDHGAAPTGRLSITGKQASLQGCAEDVIDANRFAAIEDAQGCAAVYCGLGGQCVTTANGAPACDCPAGTVAQRFNDLDGQPSVTCVPETPTCDLRAGGEVLPDACASVSCGAGRCIDRNGVAVCACDPGAAAVAGAGTSPRCEPIARATATPGAQDFSEALRDLEVCAPAPPACGPDGWYVNVGSTNPGVACAGRDLDPPAWRQKPGPAPTCGDAFGPFGCTGCQGTNAAPLATIGGSWIVFAAIAMRRRRRPRA